LLQLVVLVVIFATHNLSYNYVRCWRIVTSQPIQLFAHILIQNKWV